MRPLLAVVAGHPATGKTTVAEVIGECLGNVSVVAKDAYKELIWDTFGWWDRAWSKKVGAAATGMLLDVADARIGAGRSIVVESNFDRSYGEPGLQAIVDRHRCRVAQVVCTAQTDEIIDRFRARSKSGDRHPGHADTDFEADVEFMERLRQPYEPLRLPGPVLVLDSPPDPALAVDFIRDALRGEA